MNRKIAAILTFILLLCLAGCAGQESSAPAEEAGQEQTSSQTAAGTETSEEGACPESGETAGSAASAGPAQADDSTEYTAEVFAMDTYISLQGCGADAQAALDEIAGQITDLDSRLSVTDEGSEIYTLNHSGGTAVSLSDAAMELISFGKDLWEETGGALDISVYPVVRAWGFTGDEYRIPSDEELQDLLAHVDASAISIDEAAGTVTLEPDMELDLGAMVKGYACDLARQTLADHGVEHALLNMGASTIGLVGSKPDGSNWRVAVQDPEDTSSYAGVIEAADCVIDTSGGYERYFTDEDGTVYWHIIDPKTGKPAKSGLISSTIVSESGMLGDALSTACFVMGLDSAVSYWRENGGFEFVFITDAHEIYVSEGLADSFTPLCSYENAELTVVYREE